MKSMTGFGANMRKAKGVSVEASLRAVNGRFFDIKIHLPSEYISFEKEIREKLSKHVHRGSLSLVVLRKRTGGISAKQVMMDVDLAKQWVTGFRSLAKRLRLKDELSVESLTRFADVATVRETAGLKSFEKSLVLKCVEEALVKFNSERSREGLKLKSDILKRVRQLEKIRTQIGVHRLEAQVLIRKKFDRKREELKSFDPQRLADELVWYLEKADIDEELTRLKEHLHHFQTLLNAPGNQGKKLDFYTQELLREVNTIGSKSNHSKITQVVVEAKTLIEQIKEQVQNIE